MVNYFKSFMVQANSSYSITNMLLIDINLSADRYFQTLCKSDWNKNIKHVVTQIIHAPPWAKEQLLRNGK